jgi:hypothetical protein
MNIKITNPQELIDFVNRKDVSVLDAEKIINKCFDVCIIDFSEGIIPELTKSDLINYINDFLEPLTDTEIKQGFKIYWY